MVIYIHWQASSNVRPSYCISWIVFSWIAQSFKWWDARNAAGISLTSLQEIHLPARMSKFQGSGSAQQQKLLGSDYVLLSLIAIPKDWEYLGWKRLPSEQPLELFTCGAGTTQCFLLVSTLSHRLLIRGGVSLSHDKNKSQLPSCQLSFLQKSPPSMALMQ